ncbi:hypothetical protein C8R44DRAFT_729674 [Mycena epipterygia]|nr:hypothetical protein C8R44DRAFT_729674 [Mycena epipterygia]
MVNTQEGEGKGTADELGKDNLDDDEEEDEEDITKLHKSQATHLAITKHTQKIIGTITNGNITDKDLIESIAYPILLVAEKAEDLTLSCILCGFTCSGHWHLSQTQSAPLLKNYLLDLKPDSQNRDHKICTSGVWNLQGALQHENEAIFSGLTVQEKHQKMQEYTTDFMLFKKAHEKIIMFSTGILIHLNIQWQWGCSKTSSMNFSAQAEKIPRPLKPVSVKICDRGIEGFAKTEGSARCQRNVKVFHALLKSTYPTPPSKTALWPQQKGFRVPRIYSDSGWSELDPWPVDWCILTAHNCAKMWGAGLEEAIQDGRGEEMATEADALQGGWTQANKMVEERAR